MQWEVVIGLEVHVQLNTKSKIFSGSSTAFGAEPNRQANAFDVALPGVLPVMNREAVEKAIRFGLSIGAKVNRTSIFARKNYFYPDLPKGYQISQFELPVVEGGTLAIQVGDQEKIVELTRAHLEEDAGKSLHEDFHGMSGIDLNRAGTPLLEIVSEPVMRSSAEASAYGRALHSLVTWLDICDGNMQEGSFRMDANVSVRPKGETKLGTRCEVKNVNSFKFLEKAIDYEVRRQIELIEDGGKVVQETRLYDPDRDETRSMRSKEDAHDYRYFPDPDLLPLQISEAWIERVKAALPELPQALKVRFMDVYSLPVADASQLSSNKALASFYEATVQALGGEGKLVANWVLGEVMAQLNREEKSISDCPVSAVQLAGLLRRIQDNTISSKIAKDVLAAMWAGEGEADAVIEAKGLKQITDTGAIESMIDEVLVNNAAMIAEYKSGKEKAFNALVGQCMKASKGKANPAQVNALLKQKLDS
ncbi:Asp-tRNA(Asn)/Glu-tRNA(Gln) amidotransferase subunit GatB [Leeia sp. TBRC 13508]|uniref:Aspartyl/glutamyl-tRNA(Asn/Gln) amidotransferase subunit B n=1 Tax=Leeia speluncae TaxID=2884804 RepID=A0ABS8D8Z4_9NEIS|nr:Asp-tRNA(Asn)/Glu-tRNA(Gln) amidotransferase subunit GatB [Leeia speluncae]MCB6184098.1 Asp-tRNA(Asn)/Glu-tRNA(Gln) amidotransferase subunit GatB [Leeia speluncae]